MTRIVILGAGGFGRGIYGWIMNSPRHRKLHAVTDVVFIDDDSEPPVPPPAEIIANVRAFVPKIDDEVICAIGNPSTRRRLALELGQRGVRFHTFVDDNSILGSGVTIGYGSVICPGVVISANAQVGNHVHVNFSCSVGHDVVLGDFTTLSPSVNVMGQVHVGESVFIGGSAVILPRLQIESNALVGAGSVVVSEVKPECRVVGNPARPIPEGVGLI